MAAIGAGLPIVTTIFSYFSPSRSPYYAVIASAALSLMLSTKLVQQAQWLQVAVPVYGILLISWALSFKARSTFRAEEHEDQLRFARSLSISSGVLTIAVTAPRVEANAFAFWLNYITCLVQIIVFVLYVYARSEREEPGISMNFVQFALITTTLLIGGAYALTQFAGHHGKWVSTVKNLQQLPDQIRGAEEEYKKAKEEGKKDEVAVLAAEENLADLRGRVKVLEAAAPLSKKMSDRFLEILGGLYLLWLACILFWLRHLHRLIEFLRIRDDAGG